MVVSQEYLNIKYPKNNRNEIKKLNIKYKNLEGELKLENFDDLNELLCSSNFLIGIFFSDTSIGKLTVLDLRNNNFPQTSISFFSKFVNLEVLQIGNDREEQITQGIYNRWFGSLQSLQRLNKLKFLDIEDTDIDGGLEYLPDSVEKIYCDNNYRSSATCYFIAVQLRKYKVNVSRQRTSWVPKLENSCYYNVESWRRDNHFYQQKLILEEKVRNIRENLSREFEQELFQKSLEMNRLNEQLMNVEQFLALEKSRNKELKEELSQLREKKMLKDTVKKVELEDEVLQLRVVVSQRERQLESQKQITTQFEIWKEKGRKKKEAKELTEFIKEKVGSRLNPSISPKLVEELIEAQNIFDYNGCSQSQEKLEKAKNKLKSKLKKEDKEKVEKICQLTSEINELEMKFQDLLKQEEQLKSQIQVSPK